MLEVISMHAEPACMWKGSACMHLNEGISVHAERDQRACWKKISVHAS